MQAHQACPMPSLVFEASAPPKAPYSLKTCRCVPEVGAAAAAQLVSESQTRDPGTDVEES